MKTPRALGAAAAIACLTLLAGCSGASSSSLPAATTAANGDVQRDEAGGYADESKVPQAGPAPAENPGAVVAAQIARTARVSLTVPDVEAAASQLRLLAQTLRGQVTAENLVTRDDPDAQRGPVSTIVISVPADELDSALDQLKSVGTVTSRVISSEDVTTQVADVKSRIDTLNASIARLQELSKRAGTISQLVELENELTNRIAERDSLVAQGKSLAGRVATSPVTISLSTPGQPAQPVEPTGFLGGLLAGWNALLASSRVLMTAVGALLPFVAAIAVVALPILAWRRRTRRIRTAATLSLIHI